MRYEFCARTDRGKVRANNEDAVSVDEQCNVAVLADGMGGYNAGEVASGMATDLIRTGLARWLAQAGEPRSADLRKALEQCVHNANHAIFEASLSHLPYAGMGTTVVVGVFSGTRLLLGHVGDSRCYRLRAGRLEQITRDHSWLQEQVDAGLITAQQAAVSGGRNLVTRALGVEEHVQLELNEFQVAAGDLFVLCSDGLSEMLDHAELSAIAAAPASLDDKASRLIAAANANGGRDNISVLLVQAHPAQRRQQRGFLARWLGAA